MKKIDCLEKHIDESAKRLEELDGAKQDEYELPYFSKDVPLSSQKRRSGHLMTVTYNWQNLYETTMKIKEITYEENAGLAELYKIPLHDGVDRGAFNFRGNVYTIYKVSEYAAKKIYENAKMVTEIVEKIVGYFKTMLGNFYIIGKIEQEAWVFDEERKAEGINILNVSSLREDCKRTLFERTLEKIADLHLNDFILGNFSINSVMLHDKKLLFSDLRMLKKTRKLSFLVREFQKVISVLCTNGIVAEQEQIAYAVRYYVGENPIASKEWFKEETKREPKDDEEIAELLERKFC
ncbi:MAG: hypothetical protein QW171_00510 [Candidatus Bilamarchaeaceae archaeon]